MNYRQVQEAMQQQQEQLRFQQQHQQQQANGGFRQEEFPQGNGNFDAFKFFEDHGIKHHEQQPTDLAPLPLNQAQPGQICFGGPDRNAFEDLIKNLSQTDQGHQSTNFNQFMLPTPFNNSFASQLQGQIASQQQQFAAQNQGNLFNGLQPQQEATNNAYVDATNTPPTLSALYNGNLNFFTPAQLQKTECSSANTMALVQPPVNKPIKALSAYNFFFRDERERILNGKGDEGEYSETKKQELLDGHWFRDRTKKRRHRKTHGKIAFTDLSRMVSQRWKSLAPEKKAFYKEVAAKDLDRYRKEVHQLEVGEEGASRMVHSSVVTARSA